MTEGTAAPQFTLPDSYGNMVSLSDFKGRKVVLYFYPKDSTPGCTAEACNLRDNYEALLAQGFQIVGVSKDSANSHKKFIEKNALPFTLFSDKSTQMMQDFGAWGEKKLAGRVYDGILRTTFIISPDGIIERVITKVDTKNAASQILQG